MIEKVLSRNSLTYLSDTVRKAVDESRKRVKAGGKVVVCGNGGSAADGAHIVGELMKGFLLERKLSCADAKKFEKSCVDGKKLADSLQYGIPAVALSGAEAISTAIANDVGGEMVFAQQAFALTEKNDVFIGISTSGNAENVCLAMQTATVKGAFCIALCGKGGGKLATLADLSLVVDEKETYLIQEKHLPLYHLYCMCLENEFFGE